MWTYESAGDPKVEALIMKYTNNLELSRTVSRYCDLYAYFSKNTPRSVSTIRTTVFMDTAGIIPFFTDEASAKLVHLWGVVRNKKKYSEYIVDKIKRAKRKRGGADPAPGVRDDSQTLDDLIDWAINLFATKSEELLRSVVPTGISDMIMKASSFGTTIITFPQTALGWLENNPYIGGPLFHVAIDMFLEVVPKFLMVEELGVTAISAPLAPLGIGFITEVIGLIIAEVLGFMTFALSLAKGKKGAAFLNFIQLVPIFGPIIRQSIVNSVHIYDKVQSEKEILAQLPFVGSIFKGEMPTMSSRIPTSISSRIPTSISSRIPTSIPTSISSRIPTSIPNSISSRIPTSIPARPANGGKRLTRQSKYKHKWRKTLRQSRLL